MNHLQADRRVSIFILGSFFTVLFSLSPAFAASDPLRIKLNVRSRIDNAIARSAIDPERIESAQDVEVWEIDSQGGLETRKQSQYDPESAVVSWIADGTSTPSLERQFEIRASTQNSSPPTSGGVEIHQIGSQLVVSNHHYELTYQLNAGGMISQIVYKDSGAVVPVSMQDSVGPRWQGRDQRVTLKPSLDTAPQWHLIPGPISTVLEIKTRLLPSSSVARDSYPMAIYRYTFFTDLPVIGMEVRLPAQLLQPVAYGQGMIDLASTGESMKFMNFDFLSESFDAAPFEGWVTGDFPIPYGQRFVLGPTQTGKTDDRSYPLSEAGVSKQWAALVGERNAFGMIAPELGLIYEAKLYDAGHPQGRFLSRFIGRQAVIWGMRDPWKGEEEWSWGGHLYAGSSQGDGKVVGAAAKRLNDYALTVNASPEIDQIVVRASAAAQEARSIVAASADLSELRRSAVMAICASAQGALISAQERLNAGKSLIEVERVARWADWASEQALAVARQQMEMPNMPWVVNHAPFVAAATGGVAVLFEMKETTLELCAMVDAKTGHSFLRYDPKPHPLWELRFLDNQTGKTVSVDSRVGSANGVTFSVAPSFSESKRIVFQWSHLPVGEESGNLTVEAAVITGYDGSDDPQVYWRLRAINRSRRYGLAESDYPIVHGLGKENGSTTPDYLAVPFKSGMLIPNPGTGAAYQQSYPGEAAMQFLAYWHNRNAMMLGTLDSKGYLKQFQAYPLADGTLECRVTHLDSDPQLLAGRFPQGYFQPYPSVTRIQKGDWYDVAKQYRKWAIRQPWCPTRSLKTNPNVPQWFKDSHLTYRAQEDPADVLASIRQLNQFFQMPALVNWYEWIQTSTLTENAPEIAPVRPGFVGAMTDLQEKEGLFVVPYLMSMVWDTRTSSYANGGEASALRLADGSIKMTPYDGNPLANMCAFTSRWQEKMESVTHQLLGQHFENHRPVSGAYLDLSGTAVGAPCFSASHGHPVGGGSYYTEGMRAMLGKIRAAGRIHNPEFIMLSEGNCEVWINQVDTYLLYHSVQPTLSPMNIPIYQAVYGDYIKPYGAKRFGSAGAPLKMLMPTQAFVFGSKIGRIEVLNSYAGYYRELARYRKAAADYLVYGQMLRPLSIAYLSSSTTPLVSAGLAVQTTSWKAPNRSVGFVFANAETQPVLFRARIDAQEYELAVGQPVMRRKSDGAQEPFVAMVAGVASPVKVGDEFEYTISPYNGSNFGVLVLTVDGGS